MSLQKLMGNKSSVKVFGQPHGGTNTLLPKYYICALFDRVNSNHIVGGDFNAKHTHWASRLITSKERELYKAFASYGVSMYLPASQGTRYLIQTRLQLEQTFLLLRIH